MSLSPRMKVDLVYRLIKEALKDQAFTFDGLSVEIGGFDPMKPQEMTVRFVFNEYGNNNRSLLDPPKREAVNECDKHALNKCLRGDDERIHF